MCRSRRELSNEYLLAKIGVDTAENEPLEVWGKIFNIIHWCPYSIPRRFRSGPPPNQSLSLSKKRPAERSSSPPTPSPRPFSRRFSARLSGCCSRPTPFVIGRRTRRAASASRDVRERRLAKFRQNVARFRLYRLRFLQENTRSAAFFKIYQNIQLKILKFGNILQILQHLQNFC